MAAMNKVWLMGNLTRDPSLRHTSSGSAVAEFALAVSETRKNRDGEPVESKCFVDVVSWDKQAETCNKYLAKGSGVSVEGRLQFDQWETDQGEKRSKIKVRADRVQFLGRNGNGNGNDEGRGQGQGQRRGDGRGDGDRGYRD